MSTQTELPSRPDQVMPPGRARAGATGKQDRGIVNAFSHAFLMLWAVLVIFPLLWAVLSSFKDNSTVLSDPWSLPTELRLDNFVRAWTEANIGSYFLNTLIVMSGSLTLTMLLGAMAAYVLARYEFWGNRVIFYTFIAGMTFPLFLALVPLFFVVDNLGLRGHDGTGDWLDYVGLILVYVAYSMPFTVFFLTAFFRTLPTTVAEAGLIDGCSHSRLFFQVMLPMAKPGLISIGIFNFLGQWNQYLLPLVLMSHDEDKKVLAVGLAGLAVNQGYRGDWTALFAGMTIAMLPVLVVYLVFQRQVQAGLSAGLLK